MQTKLYTFLVELNWHIVSRLSITDRFEGAWKAMERREGPGLKYLKSIATVQSVGASTRIEGSKMTDEEVKIRIENLDITQLEERDQQEVLGYYEVLDTIFEAWNDIEVTENNIKSLHHLLMKYSEKDVWHKGDYKQHPNMVQETRADGTVRIIFRTAEPGFATEDAMRNLVEWYRTDVETHPLVKSALFVYEFLSIHPFQDGNGRLSRLLTTLLLLKNGYSWLEYISFEHEIENRKNRYYEVLMQCQVERPGEDISPWLNFFLDCLHHLQDALMKKLEADGNAAAMLPREKVIYIFIEAHPGCKSGEISAKLNIPLPTVKRILTNMVTHQFLKKHGQGAGTNYTVS